MHFSKIVLSLAMLGCFTAANAVVVAAEVAHTAPSPSILCTMGDTCYFPGEGEGPKAGNIVWFDTPTSTGSPLRYTCSLKLSEANGVVNPAQVNARVYSGGNAHFKTTEITLLTPLTLTVLVPNGDSGQIKFELAGEHSYPKESVAVTCAAST